MDAHIPERASPTQRLVVLGYLVPLWEVGIEVVLAVKDRALGQVRAERQADHEAEMDGALVRDRQAARKPQADRACVRVRLLAEGQLAAAEHLGRRSQLYMDLEPNHRLELLRTGSVAAGLRALQRLRHARLRRRSRPPARARAQHRASGSR